MLWILLSGSDVISKEELCQKIMKIAMRSGSEIVATHFAAT